MKEEGNGVPGLVRARRVAIGERLEADDAVVADKPCVLADPVAASDAWVRRSQVVADNCAGIACTRIKA